MENKTPFKIISATSNARVGGMPGSPGGTQVKIIYTSENKIQFDSIYFQGKKVKASNFDSGNQKIVSANIYHSAVKKDIEMNGDAKKEYGNTLTASKITIPFKLKEDELVISYIIKNKTKYYKVRPVKKGETIFMQ
ncbi:hypothetical protein BTO06_16215 [Tenacibaculum sp. SZ-18]|nr:hypothetical protein BTO06_16215 [Tenacibaculum sp. SZ-18]